MPGIYGNQILQSAMVVSAFPERAKPVYCLGETRLSEAERAEFENFVNAPAAQYNSDFFEENFEVVLWLNAECFAYYLGIIISTTIEEHASEGLVVDLILGMLDLSSMDVHLIPDYVMKRFMELSDTELGVVEKWIYWLADNVSNQDRDDVLERVLMQLSLIRFYRTN